MPQIILNYALIYFLILEFECISCKYYKSYDILLVLVSCIIMYFVVIGYYINERVSTCKKKYLLKHLDNCTKIIKT